MSVVSFAYEIDSNHIQLHLTIFTRCHCIAILAEWVVRVGRNQFAIRMFKGERGWMHMMMGMYAKPTQGIAFSMQIGSWSSLLGYHVAARLMVPQIMVQTGFLFLKAGSILQCHIVKIVRINGSAQVGPKRRLKSFPIRRGNILCCHFTIISTGRNSAQLVAQDLNLN